VRRSNLGEGRHNGAAAASIIGIGIIARRGPAEPGGCLNDPKTRDVVFVHDGRPMALSSRFPDAIVARQTWRFAMARGTVKWFNSQKGYGFIAPQGGGKDVFVHISAVERAGLSTLNEGQVVEFEEVANKGKTSAENLKIGKGS
jgi:cold shock protein